ncbi:MAG: alpha-ketoacid dehydrogenase subunit beta [Caldilineae bacterium]|nr:MAG: alpha-ketoacid dehydrogenase subunit beta [Caldilineae bacterium]
MHRILAEDERAVVLGEDILDPYGGAFKVTSGLSTRFPERVWTTPISEAAIVGIANGMALRGLHPVVEIMFGDFITLAADQIVNHAAKFAAMYNNRVSVPLVIRTPMGGGRGYGPTHSQSLEKLFLGVPHLTVIAPSLFHDPGECLYQAVVRDPTPVLFIEHKLLYPTRLLRPGEHTALRIETWDTATAYPTMLVHNYERGEPDVVLITYGGTSRLLPELLRDLRDEEIRVSAVLPALLQPLPIEAMVELAGRAGRVVVVEDGVEGFGWSSEVAVRVYERLGKALHAPIARVAARPTVIPASALLEAEVLVGRDDIEQAIWQVLY